MALSLSLRTPELLHPYFRLEMESFVAALQVQFDRNLPAPVHTVDGELVPLSLSLRTPELLGPYERAELEQILASLQTAFAANPVTSIIKRIQRGTITIAASAATGTATIQVVDLATSVLHFGGFSTTSGSALLSEGQVMVAPTNATTITARRSAATLAIAIVVGFTIVEYQPGVLKSVQYGTVIHPGTAATSASTNLITAVDLDKASVQALGIVVTDASAWTASSETRLVLSSTAVTAETSAAGYVQETGFVVVEAH